MASSSNECNEAEIDVDKFREDFCDTISKLPGCMRHREYEKVVRKLQLPSYRGEEKEKFDVTHKRGKLYLIDKCSQLNAPKRKHLSVEDMFQIIYEAHFHVDVNGHLDLIQMRELIAYTHPNFVIPAEAIDWVVNNCKVCTPQNSDSKEIVSNNFKTGHKHDFDRNQYVHYKVLVSICDMSKESVRDSPFKYVLIYKDAGYNRSHTFILLRPLIDNSTFEVASELAKIFFTFGPPRKILVNKGEGEYFDRVKCNLSKLCGECDVIIGVCPERATAKTDKYVVEKILQWEKEMGSSEWALGCHIVQWKLNQKRKGLESPYEKMFSVTCEKGKQKKSTTSPEIIYIEEDKNDNHLDSLSAVDAPPVTGAKSNLENEVASQDNIARRDSNLISIDQVESLESTEDEDDQNQHQHSQKVLSSDGHKSKTAITSNSIEEEISSCHIQNQYAPNPTTSNSIEDAISSFHIPNQHPQEVQKVMPSDEHDTNTANTSNFIETAIVADENCSIIVKEESENLQLNTKLTKDLVRSICDDFNIVLYPSDRDIATDAEVQEKQNNNYENNKLCKVCQIVILKYFVCVRCKEYVHLYCAVQRRTAEESQVICFLCASL
ncbi:uncharacterized protein LOC135083333 [Ostrinia nubilalis]|uniref:uncharacterized protein LOC135083333 n=1 Tax=Ostrinia nubilalis TaxID=29057 RepID=UPI0030824ACE